MENLTERQQEIVDFIRSYSEAEGMPPSLRDIGEKFQIEVSTAFGYIQRLEEKGALERLSGRSRGIRLVEQPASGATRRVPIMGKTTAGLPALALENPEGFLTVDASAVKGENVFALQVEGDSMIEKRIFDGDYALIRQQPTVEDGESALVLIDGEEATIKRFYRHGKDVELKPANPAYKSIVRRAAQIQVQGKVIGVYRVFE